MISNSKNDQLEFTFKIKIPFENKFKLELEIQVELTSTLTANLVGIQFRHSNSSKVELMAEQNSFQSLGLKISFVLCVSPNVEVFD